MQFKKTNSKTVLCGDSFQGEAHIRLKLPNQDSLALGKYRSGFICAAVADGVGSCKHSQQGAKYAACLVRNLCARAPKWLEDPAAAQHLQNYIIESWKRKFGSTLDDYATTLNFLIITKKWVWLGQIGDGLILAKTGKKFIVLEETNSLPPYTFALSSYLPLSCFRVCCLPKRKQMAFFLASDGIGRAIEPELFTPFLKYISKVCLGGSKEAAKEVKQWIGALNRLNQDDKTFGVYVCQ